MLENLYSRKTIRQKNNIVEKQYGHVFIRA